LVRHAEFSVNSGKTAVKEKTVREKRAFAATIAGNARKDNA